MTYCDHLGSYFALSKMPCASTHLHLVSRGHGQRHHTSTRPPNSSTLCQQQHLPHTYGASCSTHNAASRLDHCTNLRVRCCHCRYCATVGCSVVALQAAGEREDEDEDMDVDKVKSAPPRPISSLQSLSAHGKPVADQTNALRDFPTQQLSQPASFSWLLRARARWPRVRMKKPQTANLPGLPSSCCQLHNN
jgi:hypothetical protein